MGRRNSGARLAWLDKRGCFYIVWTEGGRSRQRSTGAKDRELAEIALAEFLHVRLRSDGPRDPSEILVTDALADYAEEVAPATAAPWRIGLAVRPLTRFWTGRTIVEVTKETCRRYVLDRGRSNGTARRELGVLRAAINHAHREGRLTRTVAVYLPAGAEPRDRWLTRGEVAATRPGLPGGPNNVLVAGLGVLRWGGQELEFDWLPIINRNRPPSWGQRSYSRPRFICPTETCRAGAYHVFLTANGFCCRKCAGVEFPSRTDRDRYERNLDAALSRRILKLRSQLGITECPAFLAAPPPPSGGPRTRWLRGRRLMKLRVLELQQAGISITDFLNRASGTTI